MKLRSIVNTVTHNVHFRHGYRNYFKKEWNITKLLGINFKNLYKIRAIILYLNIQPILLPVCVSVKNCADNTIHFGGTQVNLQSLANKANEHIELIIMSISYSRARFVRLY